MSTTSRPGRKPHDAETCVICNEIALLLDTRGAEQAAAAFGIKPASLRAHLYRHSHPTAGRVPWRNP